MQQRQLRLGDILDDYCPRERRLTNHAIVAMVGSDVRQTRCTTCDAEHEYKHARVPRPRTRPDAPALNQAPGAPVPKRQPAAVEAAAAPAGVRPGPALLDDEADEAAGAPGEGMADGDDRDRGADDPGETGPVHRRLIRATLPRLEGQPPPPRPPSEFTIRQTPGRGQRFRPRQARADQPFHGGSRMNGGGNSFRGGPHQNQGRGGPASRPSNRRGHGGRRPK